MKCKRSHGITLIEIIVVSSIVGVLFTLVATTSQSLWERTRRVECATRMRNIGIAIRQYGIEHLGEFPRSSHSAAAHRDPGWARSLLPYFADENCSLDDRSFNEHYRCPSHKETKAFVYSYALNVYFELNPRGDDYVGSPETWRTLQGVPTPHRTLLLAESKPIAYGDHLMCHLWSSTRSAENALSYDRHDGKANYLFVDGHVETLAPKQTLNPQSGVDLWNPSLAN